MTLCFRCVLCSRRAHVALHLLCLQVLDTTFTNVAMLKPTTSTTQNGTYLSSMGNNGVIDMDNLAAGDMTYSLACDGTAWWMVDLGGIFNISTVMLFNRFPYTSTTTIGSGIGARMAGATLLLLNWNGDAVGNYTLTGNMIQTFIVPTYAPTPSITSSQTPSQTSTTTATQTQTISPTASLGSSHTATPSATMTPLSPNPNKLRINWVGTTVQFNMVEVMVFDINNRLVSAAAAGGVATQINNFGGTQVCPNGGLPSTGWCAAWANDMNADPITMVNVNQCAAGNNAGETLAWWQVR